MTDCQCFSPWKDCEGAMIVGNKCRAINGGSKGVYARARCLKGVTSVSTQISQKSGHHDDDKASTTCPSGTQLIGCTCQSSGGHGRLCASSLLEGYYLYLDSNQ